jgi:hypothetical protein
LSFANPSSCSVRSSLAALRRWNSEFSSNCAFYACDAVRVSKVGSESGGIADALLPVGFAFGALTSAGALVLRAATAFSVPC